MIRLSAELFFGKEFNGEIAIGTSKGFDLNGPTILPRFNCDLKLIMMLRERCRKTE